MYAKILIANRGEIAVRIIRACKEMGIATVAVYSKEDAECLHVALADESYCIGRGSAGESYLNGQSILSAALVSGAQAIHPGYGFLSENAAFARRCWENGVAFIGPDQTAMEHLSDKVEVKARMERAGLPGIPGTGLLHSVGEAEAAAERIGYPVLLKASAGGGGRGIRLVNAPGELPNAYLTVKSESAAAFQDDGIYMEKFIRPARHVEVQVLADQKGQVVCLGERDCSTQKHNQKMLEESPSPAVTPAQRAALMKKVAKAVKSLGYTGVGTLEFLMSPAGAFYFMEMNIRLQVEHTVTEMLTGVDLVKWQIRTAAGVPLDFAQEDIRFRGCAMECRIVARAPGKVKFLHVPGGPFVRFDSGLTTGMKITPYYDPMIGKLIVSAASREELLRKMKAALCELVIEGIPTNIEELMDILDNRAFRQGTYHLGTFAKGEEA